ncbi:MAG TPA: Xaa-Pro peptidase family protein [Actinomycetota bacterium]|nr:Xaa-Pro peptidase family protein [Actinomycetota bacterium]
MPPSDHALRLSRAAEAAAEEGVGALVVAPSADLVYLTGYSPPALPRLTCLVVRTEGPPVLVVPRLEQPLAEDAGVADLAEIRAWAETEDPYAAVGAVIGAAERVACSDRLWASHLLGLQRAAGASFISAAPILGRLRAIKDRQELDLLKRAARYADETFARLIQTRLETRSEREVAGLLADLLRETGNDEINFTIVGAGPNGASPHHEPTGREILHGDPVVLDFGGRTAGYCSDITRTVVVGKPPDDFTHVYDVVREAQEEAFRAVEPGVRAEDVDRAARRVIDREGFGELFVHRTGHGIGLDEHEAPYIVGGNREPLRPGMCFSIEPGIYVPGEFGIRIEDIVTVTETGAQRLNHAPRELEVVR